MKPRSPGCMRSTGATRRGWTPTLSTSGRPVPASASILFSITSTVNWIPDDHFLTRITAERVERRLDRALAANANMIRIWGGGIFESDHFYRACDEGGLLVWQDFLVACAA
jgi:beta-mannosidase